LKTYKYWIKKENKCLFNVKNIHIFILFIIKHFKLKNYNDKKNGIICQMSKYLKIKKYNWIHNRIIKSFFKFKKYFIFTKIY